MQRQCRKVVNVDEEGHRQIIEAVEEKGLQRGWTYDIREGIFHFTADTNPMPKILNRQIL